MHLVGYLYEEVMSACEVTFHSCVLHCDVFFKLQFLSSLYTQNFRQHKQIKVGENLEVHN
jgi:hypothetical protein